MKELGARLERLELSASNPRALADFYVSTFQMQVMEDGGCFTCRAAGRTLVFVQGAAGQLRQAVFRFAAMSDYERCCQRLMAHKQVLEQAQGEGVAVRDFNGHLFRFLPPDSLHDRDSVNAGDGAAARLQHFALQTPQPARLAAFCTDILGLVVSDRVLDAQGDLTAIFLRSDTEHHCLALFRAPAVRFDHFSCEVPSWLALRDWADHMASVGVDLAWGIGRHGPGNDTFLMVRDVDGNMGEISCDMEICRPDRPVGVWPHRPQTLNQWGVAIMRS